MKINWGKLIFCVIMMSVWAMVMVCFIKLGSEGKDARETKKENHEQNLRDNYSPMSEDAEIQEAYDAIRNK